MSTSSLSLVMEGESLASMRRRPILGKNLRQTMSVLWGNVHVGIRDDGIIVNINITITSVSPTDLQLATQLFLLGPLDQILEAYENVDFTTHSKSSGLQVLKELEISGWPNGKVTLYAPTQMGPRIELANSTSVPSHHVNPRISCIS